MRPLLFAAVCAAFNAPRT